jgi:uncharacterized protein (DUF1778 family)
MDRDRPIELPLNSNLELDQEAWDEFSELLDRPAAVPEGLTELFSKPSVLK